MNEVIEAVSKLSVLVVIYDGNWKESQFHPNCNSTKVYNWFEGTGTIIGTKRNRVVIMSSIHCNPSNKCCFFIKGEITNQIQIKATLCINCYVEDNNGIDVAIFSCHISNFHEDILLRYLPSIKWCSSLNCLQRDSRVCLVHYPTFIPQDTDMSNQQNEEQQDSTYRLFHSVYPSQNDGILISYSLENYTFDSTIIATCGSSGGIIINEEGLCLGVHDSQHNENILMDGINVSTHRMICDIRDKVKEIKYLQDLFPE